MEKLNPKTSNAEHDTDLTLSKTQSLHWKLYAVRIEHRAVSLLIIPAFAEKTSNN
jgi:hypothetical protein